MSPPSAHVLPVAWGLAAGLLLFAAPRLATALQYPLPGQLIADCGDDDERYLAADHGSAIREYTRPRMFQHARYASRSAGFTYAFPIARSAGQAYLAFEAQGECKVTAEGATLVDEGPAGYGEITPYQFLLTDRSLWADGRLEVTFADSDPSDGGGPSVLWIECGSTTRYRQRISHVEWGTTRIVWSLGLWDGTAHEFAGAATEARIGRDHAADLVGAGELTICWDQEIRPGREYYLILAYLRGSGGIDPDGDGVFDLTGETKGEEALDLEVTDQIRPVGNVARVSAPGGWDCIALVEVDPSHQGSPRVSFHGTPEAEALSRAVENTWFWILGMHYDNTGFVDASPINGNWFQQYWPIDTAWALRELVAWGYLDQAIRAARLAARVGWKGHWSNRSGGWDNTAGNILVIDFANLLARSGYDPALVKDLWPAIEGHCRELEKAMRESPFGLVKGTNWENAGNRTHGPCFALTTNSGAYYALLRCGEAARAIGKDGLRAQWRASAARLRRAMLDRLVYQEDTAYDDAFVIPKGTWKYGIIDDGTVLRDPLWGFFWAGSVGSGYFGLIDAHPELRQVTRTTERFVADLFARYQREGRGVPPQYSRARLDPFSLTLSDDPDLYGPAIQQRVIDRLDYAQDVGSAVAELSRWAWGKARDVEDTNLVGTGWFLGLARMLAGVDDSLYARTQLRLIPRLPWNWSGCQVRGWPVQYRATHGIARTHIYYHYQRHAQAGRMKVWSADGTKIPHIRVRLGPFSPSSRVLTATVDDKPVAYVSEISGTARWVWVGLDVSGQPSTAVVRVEPAPVAHTP